TAAGAHRVGLWERPQRRGAAGRRARKEGRAAAVTRGPVRRKWPGYLSQRNTFSTGGLVPRKLGRIWPWPRAALLRIYLRLARARVWLFSARFLSPNGDGKPG